MLMTIVEVSATVLDSLFALWFIPNFVGTPLRSKRYLALIPVFQCIFQLFFDYTMPGFTLLPMFMHFTLMMAFAILLRPKKIFWDIFAAIAYILVIMLTGSLVFAFLSLFINNSADLIQGADANVRLINLAISKTMQFIIYYLLLTLFRRDNSMTPLIGLLTIILSAATVTGLVALMGIAVAIGKGTANTPILILVLVLILSNVLLFVFVRQIQKLQQSKYELKLMNERIAFEEKRYEEASTVWNNIRKVRHDLKNHLAVMQVQLENGQTDSCREYLGSIQETVDSMGTLFRSENSVVDYLINSKLSNLTGVQVVLQGSVGDFSDISDADMVCILGNILDNAVEALEYVSSERKVELYFSKQGQNRILVCKNSVAAPVLSEGKRLSTTKSDREKHGLGHQIVESTVKRYGGLVDYFEENGMFGVQISIPEAKKS